MERGIRRDAARLAGREAAEVVYREWYTGAFAIYEEAMRPDDRAHVIG